MRETKREVIKLREFNHFYRLLPINYILNKPILVKKDHNEIFINGFIQFYINSSSLLHTGHIFIEIRNCKTYFDE